MSQPMMSSYAGQAPNIPGTRQPAQQFQPQIQQQLQEKPKMSGIQIAGIGLVVFGIVCIAVAVLTW